MKQHRHTEKHTQETKHKFICVSAGHVPMSRIQTPKRKVLFSF